MFNSLNFRYVKAAALATSAAFGVVSPELISDVLIGLTAVLSGAEVGQAKKEKAGQ